MRLSSIIRARVMLAGLVVASVAVAPGSGRAAVAGPATAEPNPLAWAVSSADTAVRESPSAVRGAPGEAYSVAASTVDTTGAAHIRYTRSYRGLRVLGGDFVVHLAPGGAHRGTSVGLAEPLAIRTEPKVGATDAAATAVAAFTGTVESVDPSELIVDATSGTGRLAWETVVRGRAAGGDLPSRMHVVTDALTGEQRTSFDEIKPVDGTGHSIYSGTVAVNTSKMSGEPYRLEDPERFRKVCDAHGTVGCEPFSALTDADNVWGNGANTDRNSAGVDAFYGGTVAYNYFKNVHLRDGVLGNGRSPTSIVHYGGLTGAAFWNGVEIVYGDGSDNTKPSVPLDIVGHEHAHALVESLIPPSGLITDGEPGALSEATGDIFGSMIEFYANNPADPGDYTIGEKIGHTAETNRVRHMYNPAVDGFSIGCWSSIIPTYPIEHESAGIANHFFFNLAEGTGVTPYGTSPICGSALPVTGIGRHRAARIWYNALAYYFTSTTAYVNAANPANTARAATLAAATDLFGACSADYRAVQLAWSAVSVAGTDALCPGPSMISPSDHINPVSQPLVEQLFVSGGYAPYQWSATGLPPGLAIHPTGGSVTGTPTAPGSYLVSVVVTDFYGRSGGATFYWHITLPVPNLVGKTQSQATSTLQGVGLRVGTIGTIKVNESIDGGKVRSQNPPAGTQVPLATSVNLTIGIWNGNRF